MNTSLCHQFNLPIPSLGNYLVSCRISNTTWFARIPFFPSARSCSFTSRRDVQFHRLDPCNNPYHKGLAFTSRTLRFSYCSCVMCSQCSFAFVVCTDYCTEFHEHYCCTKSHPNPVDPGKAVRYSTHVGRSNAPSKRKPWAPVCQCWMLGTYFGRLPNHHCSLESLPRAQRL